MMSTRPYRSLTARGIALSMVMGWSCVSGVEATAAPPSAEAKAEDVRDTDTQGTVHIELRTRTSSPKLTRKLAEQFDETIEARVTEVGLVLEPTPAADVIVQLEISQPQPQMQLYVIQCVAVIDGDVVVRGEVQSCMDCNATELIDQGLELLPDVAEAVSTAKREAEQAAADAQATVEPAPPPPEVEPALDRRLGAMGIIGISTSVLGLGSSVVGAALLARGDNQDETNGYSITIINYRPPGWALVGVGLTATVVGNVLLGLDLGLPRPRRQRERARVTGVGAHMSEAPGLLVQGRF